MHWLYHLVRHTLAHWGYLALILALLAENAGLPVPGETTLMFASFLAHKQTGLNLIWIILAGTAAAIAGDNLGYLLGRKLKSTFIRWLKKILRMDDEDIGAAKDQMRRHGAATVFWARYIFGLRTIAGPLAGTLGMDWKRFAIFNALGAATWVTSIAVLGYVFANQFETLLGYIEKASWAIAGGLALTGYLLWRRQKKRYKERQKQPSAA